MHVFDSASSNYCLSPFLSPPASARWPALPSIGSVSTPTRARCPRRARPQPPQTSLTCPHSCRVPLNLVSQSALIADPVPSSE
ncbi:hypothetical protein EVAR_25984_1 [Eumeta japonica]|uniref:Uncharacterized protein n=1 Tax=Eumeta variegata TaxID=151549 RepID=A0A4C1V1G9_EUMVA|nr:hypothetical protein EVAR_25984_1 [Eumeta japonica]